MAYFTVTIRKSFGGYRWVNGYLMQADTLTIAKDASEGLVVAEKNMHLASVDFESMRVAGYKSADPNDFVVVPLSGSGDRPSVAGTAAAPFVAVHMSLASSSGRPGKKLYRYCLSRSEVHGSGDQALLDVASEELADWLGVWQLYLNSLASETPALMMGAPDGSAGARRVSGFSVVGAAQLDVRHGWFNRAAGA